MMDLSIFERLSDADAEIISDILKDEFKWEYTKYGFKEYGGLYHAVNDLVKSGILEPTDTVYAKARGRNSIPFANNYRVTKDFSRLIK